MIDLQTEIGIYRARVCDVDHRVDAVFQLITAEFDPSLGVTAGTCGGAHILINPNQSDEDQRDTLGHEIAHALDHGIFHGRGHGYGWGFWMRKLGLKPERYHKIEDLIRQHPRAVYRSTCHDCGASQLTTYVPRICGDPSCESPDIKVEREGVIK